MLGLKLNHVSKRGHKWFVTSQEYPRSHYSPFAAGPRYLVPMTIASALLNVSLNTPFLHLEGVYMVLLLDWKRLDMMWRMCDQ